MHTQGHRPCASRDYLDGAEYYNGTQDIIHFTEGYAQRDPSTDGDWAWQGWVYKYALKDHLGNTRVTFSDRNNDGSVTTQDVEQLNNFYPFGMNMEGNWSGADGKFKYGYNGKEWNDDFGLGWNDYGARWYDPSVPRWWNVDPLSENMPSYSPYNYAFDNPIRFTDPNGMSPASNDWVPEIKDKQIVLKKEEGDDAQSLAKFLNVDQRLANKLYSSISNDGILTLTDEVSGVKAINEALKIDYPSFKFGVLTQNYNCWECAISTSKNETPRLDYVMDRFEFKEII